MSRFAPLGIEVPAGFEQLLEAVTREILRAQPADIVTFSAEYFKRKVALRDGNLAFYTCCFIIIANRGKVC